MAKLIIDMLNLVESTVEEDIVTGSRKQYIGKKYYAEVLFCNEVKSAVIQFTYSKFNITVHFEEKVQPATRKVLEDFYREKAEEKFILRIRKVSK